MDQELSYLEDYLREEFSNDRTVRIRVVSPSGTTRSVDLEQDYDPRTSSVHSKSGVMVTTHRTEYFFPREWITQSSRALINELLAKIRSTTP
jgi:hypothetical protein